jgi:tyramine---L-glutamate ligase
LLGEGYAMLRSLASDLIACGHTVHTLMEPSIAKWTERVYGEQGTNQTGFISSPISFQSRPDLDGTLQAWLTTARSCDATIVIAPELDQILPKLLMQLRNQGISVIASSDDFVAAAADKWETSRCWSRSGIAHPATMLLDAWLKNDLRLHQPSGWVLKRRWGAGGTDLRRFRDAQSLREHCTSDAIPEACRADWIVQPWIEGIPASLAVVASEHCHVLGAMQQHFAPSDGTAQTIAYVGGSGPLSSCSPEALQEFANRTLQALPGRPRGWIGIDFIIEQATGWRAIEVNSRLTSSYLGYRQIFGPNVAQAILDGETTACSHHLRESCCFSVADFRG